MNNIRVFAALRRGFVVVKLHLSVCEDADHEHAASTYVDLLHTMQ